MQWIILILLGVALVMGISTKDSNDEAQPVQTLENSSNVLPQEKVIETGTSVLNLSNQGLTQVPSSIFNQKEVVTLNLSNNKLTGSLQAEIRLLSKLKTLDLSNNQFTGVPAEIGQLINLETLNLSHNNLTGLPHELSNLKKLKLLDLRGNKPSEFDLKIITESLSNTQILVE